MSSAAIREKLYDYIRVADEKKLKAIYNLLEDDIIETNEWWKNTAMIKELDKRYSSWQSGKEKAFTKQEILSDLSQLKKVRAKK